jgi:hypothetical protein
MTSKQLRIQLLERQAERGEHLIRRYMQRRYSFFALQLGAIVAGFLVSLVTFRLSLLLSIMCVGVAAGVFVFGLYMLRSLKEGLLRAEIWVQLKKTSLARLHLDWEHIPQVEQESNTTHPFEHDLDISGHRSLHQLVNTGFSDGGRQRLLQWLLAPMPDQETISTRQRVVRELLSRPGFLDKLQIASYRSLLSVEQHNDQEMISHWLAVPWRIKPPVLILVFSLLFSLVFDMLLVLYFYANFSLVIVGAAGAAMALWLVLTSQYRVRLFEDASAMQAAFKQLHAVFTFLEKYPYGNSHHLKEICAPVLHAPQKPSHLFKRLKSISRWIQITQGSLTNTVTPQSPVSMQAMENQAWSLFINAFFPLDMLLAFRLAQWKEAANDVVPKWLELWYELEALCSLATYAYLNPDFTFPKILEEEPQDKAVPFKAIGLGHPLLADTVKVVNDVTFEQPDTLLLVTGSNMAGKSTFLRTLGINLCLAYAGGPVNATSFQTTLFELHCCIRVSDSLADGYSYFYAEVQRLKEIMDRLKETHPYPLFVLIDEIFKGTNNHERLVGSAAYIYALTESGTCTGAISTHDLELVKVTNELPQIKNYHFREDVIDGKMMFDYHLWPGPSPTTNALKIMQIAGLPVDWKRGH